MSLKWYDAKKYGHRLLFAFGEHHTTLQWTHSTFVTRIKVRQEHISKNTSLMQFNLVFEICTISSGILSPFHNSLPSVSSPRFAISNIFSIKINCKKDCLAFYRMNQMCKTYNTKQHYIKLFNNVSEYFKNISTLMNVFACSKMKWKTRCRKKKFWL